MKIDLLSDISKTSTTQLIVIKHKEEVDITSIVEYVVKENKSSCIYFKYIAKKDIDSKLQLNYSCETIYHSLDMKSMRDIKDWTDLFIYLKRAISKKLKGAKHNTKVVIFLDKISLFTKDEEADFLNSFGYFYNTFCQKNKNFLVILGSSDTAWVDGRLLKDVGSLYQRFDGVVSII